MTSVARPPDRARAAGHDLHPPLSWTPPSWPLPKRTAEAHAKKYPACLQGALGVSRLDGLAVAGATFPQQQQQSMD
eukprot:4434614-Pyramimonas_sp.AAC.1